MLTKLLMLSILLLVSACSTSGKKNEITEVTPAITQAPPQNTAVSDKPLLEQAVDWCNDNLFEDQAAYDVFTLEKQSYQGKDYSFLLRTKGSWEWSLYYIQFDAQNRIEQITPCGSGNEEWFFYEIVDLSGENYAAVYCASHMGNGDLELFPLDNMDSSTYIIDNVIDHHYEEMALVDDEGKDYTKSQIYDDGRLEAEYTDVNEDGYTDVVLSGVILQYERYSGALENTLKKSQNCTRTYLYNSDNGQFELFEENMEDIYDQEEGFFFYTGYMDVHPVFAKDNPKYDYDGDGLPDRVYKQYDNATENNTFYLRFGNGSELVLSDAAWGITFKTEAADMTGDGVNEILFEQFSTSTKCQNLYVTVFTLIDGSYEPMDIPYYGDASAVNEVDRMLYLPIAVTKITPEMVRITQPDSGYQGFITTRTYTYINGETDNEMDHLSFPDSDGIVEKTQASEMRLIDTGDHSRKAFLLRSYLGDKWCAKSVDWKLEYLEEKWQITDIYQADPIRVALGTEFKADLNSDKSEDTVLYGTRVEQENGYSYDMPLLVVNGTEYAHQYLEEQFGVYMSTCSKIGYYIVDLDTADGYREIAILDEGPSDDWNTFFFRYTGEELIYCGSVTDFPDTLSFYTYGDGSLTAKKRLSILQTWWAPATWTLNEDSVLEEQISDVYYPYWQVEDDERTNYAKADLALFQKADKKSETLMVKKGEKLQLTATDNKNWVQITTGSGTAGWFYLHDGYEVTLPTGEVRIGDIVTYLNMAD